MTDLPRRSRLLGTLFNQACLGYALALLSGGCGAMKLKLDANCLNEKSACFRADMTRPQILSANPPDQSVFSLLSSMTVTFSEELRDGTDLSQWSITQSGGNLTITGITQLPGTFTYQLNLANPVPSGQFTITAKATDYNGQTIINPVITYTGNLDIPINLSTNHDFITTAGGFTDATLTFTHNFQADDNNTWRAYLDSADCSGTQVAQGTGPVKWNDAAELVNVYPGGADGIATDKNIYLNAAAGVVTQRLIRICYSNPGQNKYGNAPLMITVDNSPPNTWATPAGGAFASPGTISLFCDDNCLKIAYTLDGSAPAMDMAGVISNGVQYSASIPMPYAGNPTNTTLRFLAVDRSGKTVTGIPRTFQVDTRVPNITLVSNSHSYLTTNTGATASPLNNLHLSGNVVWQSSLAAKYTIRVSPSDCASVVWTGIATTTTAGANISSTINATDLSPGINTVYLCAQETTTGTYLGSYPLTFFRDDTNPVFNGILSLGNPGSGQALLSWLAATDDTPVEYIVCQTTTPTACNEASFTASYGGNGSITGTSFTVSGLVANQTYYFVVQARDATGRATNTTNEKQWTSPYLQVQLAGLPGGGNINLSRTGSASSDTLSLTANGSYPFPTPLFIGDSYSIRVTATIPAGYSCVVADNAFGNISNMTTTVAITCAQGYMVGGSFLKLPPATLKFLPFQGTAANFAGTGALSSTGDGGAALSATLNQPEQLTSDGQNLYITTTNGANRIRKIDLGTNIISTLIQSSGACSGASPYTLTTIGFLSPMALANDGTNLYIADHTAHVIFRMPLAGGPLTKIAGSGTGCNAFNSAEASSNDNTNPLLATFKGLNGLAFANGSLYISEYYGERIRRMDLATGAVTTVVAVTSPAGLAVAGNYLYYASTTDNQIRRIALTNHQLDSGFVVGVSGGGFEDGPFATAKISRPLGMTSDGTNLFITEYQSGTGGRRVRKIDLVKGRVSLIAGPAFETTTAPGAFVAARGASARFVRPRGIASDGRNLYVAESGTPTNNRVIKITDTGLVGYWPLARGTEDYSAAAIPQNGSLAGTPVPTFSATDRFGNANGAYDFDGNSQYITAPAGNLPVGNATRSLCAWVYIPGIQNMHDGIASYGFTGANTSAFGLTMDSDTSSTFKVWEHNSGDVPANTRLTPGKWSHICALHDGGTGRTWAYMNGRPVASVNSQTLATGTTPMVIGNNDSAAAYKLTGSVADVVVYNRILNEGEVNELAQDALPSQVGQSYSTGATGLLSHYEFRSGSLADSGVLNLPLSSVGSPATIIGKDGESSGVFFLDGAAQFLQTNSPAGLPLFSQPRTLCAFVKIAVQPGYSPGARFPIISYGDMGGSYFDLVYYNFSTSGINEYRLALSDNGATIHEVQAALPIHTWQHLCLTNDGSLTRLYRDGAIIYSGGSVLSGPTGLNRLTIGMRISDASKLTQGAIDDVRIYNHALTQNQIRQIAAQVPTGLLSRYDFTGDAQDASGFAHHAVNNGAVAAADRFGNANSAYSYSNGQYHQAPPLLHMPGTDMTITAWIKPSALPANSEVFPIAGNLQADYARGAVVELFNNAGLQSVYWLNKINPSTNNDFQAPYSIPFTFNHIAITRSGTTRIVYLNGAPLPGTPGGANAGDTSSTGDFLIGRRVDSGTVSTVKYFEGTIDDVRVYNRALSPEEVRALVGYHPLQVSTGVSSVALHVQADSITATHGAGVGTWTDSGPAENNLTGGILPAGCTGPCLPQVNPTYRTNSLNGKPAVRFDSGNDIMTRAAPSGVTQNSSVFSVGTPLNVSGSLIMIGNPMNGISVFFSGGKMVMESRLIGDVCVASASNFSVGNPWLAGYAFSSGTTRDFYWNGAPDLGAGPFCGLQSFALGTASITVGSDGANAGHYDLNELLYFNTALLAPDAMIVNCYLSAKYMLPLTPGVVCP